MTAANAIATVHRRHSLGMGEYLHVGIGFSLVCAACLKGTGPSPEWVGWFGVRIARLAVGSIALFEASLGLWLLSGLAARVSRTVVVVTLFCFLVASGLAAARGHDSCGCFGALRINPWYTFVIDFGVLYAVLLQERPAPTARYLPLRIAIMSAAGGTGLLAVWLSSSLAVSPSEEVVVLQPAEWVGLSFPLQKFIEPSDALKHGAVTAVFYHHACAKCVGALTAFESRARAGERIVLIEMPPYAPARADPVPRGTACLRAKLSSRRRWFLHTPTVVCLSDGMVINMAN